VGWALRAVLASAAALAAPAAAEETPQSPECGRSIQEIADGFIPLFYEQGRVREAYETYVAEDYVQHNPHATDGRDAAIAFLEPFYERNPGHHMIVHRVLVDEPYIAVHLHGRSSTEDRGAAAVDILRVENCMIVEHWDVTQPVPERPMNDNGMF
jgi:predicted SnoaL-like aldol condensation-catalyzing enzyme